MAVISPGLKRVADVGIRRAALSLCSSYGSKEFHFHLARGVTRLVLDTDELHAFLCVSGHPKHASPGMYCSEYSVDSRKLCDDGDKTHHDNVQVAICNGGC